MDRVDWPIVSGDDEHLELVIEVLDPNFPYTWKSQVRAQRDVGAKLLAEPTVQQTTNGAGHVLLWLSLTPEDTRKISVGAPVCGVWWDVQMIDEVGDVHTPAGGVMKIERDVTE